MMGSPLVVPSGGLCPRATQSVARTPEGLRLSGRDPLPHARMGRSDPYVFRFYRSLSAYERALKGSNSTLVITPDSEFFEFLDGAGLSSGAGN